MRHVSSSFIKFHQELLFTPNKLSPLLDLVLLHAGYHLRAQGDLPEGNECLSAEHICTNMYKMNCGCQTCYGKAV